MLICTLLIGLMKDHIHSVKSYAPPIFLLKQLSNYRQEILLNMKSFIRCKILHKYFNKYLRIRVIFAFYYKIVSFHG